MVWNGVCRPASRYGMVHGAVNCTERSVLGCLLRFISCIQYLPSTDEKMSLPEPNSFIPTNLELLGPRNAETPFPRPLCIKQTSGQRIWWKQDDRLVIFTWTFASAYAQMTLPRSCRWKVPRAAFWLKMAKSVPKLLQLSDRHRWLSACVLSPMLDLSSKNRILSSAYIYLVSDALEQHTYDASVAGLAFQLSLGRESMELRLRGYTDKMMVLLKVGSICAALYSPELKDACARSFCTPCGILRSMRSVLQL